MDMGVAMFAGEARKARLDEVLLDAWNGTLEAALHTWTTAEHGGHAAASLPTAALARNEGRISSFDLGRGCPFQCSFCTIINVQGRKSRFRTADDLEAIVRDNYRQGITTFFITDDNMARNKHWEDFFDRLIELKENEGIELFADHPGRHQCHVIPNFIAKARWAGVFRVFIGWRTSTGQPAGRQEAPEQNYRVPQDAAGLATPAGPRPGRAISWASRRHARVDPARHGDHQEGVAARHPRAVHPDAAARLGRSPDPVEAGRLDGSGLNKYDVHHRVVITRG